MSQFYVESITYFQFNKFFLFLILFFKLHISVIHILEPSHFSAKKDEKINADDTQDLLFFNKKKSRVRGNHGIPNIIKSESYKLP